MKISVKSSSGGGMFGGGPSSEVTIEAADYDSGAGWGDGDKKADPGQRESNPGDAVRITWHGDDSSRLFIDSGTMWVSPAIAGLITEPMSVEYNTTDITVEVVAPFESNRNRGA